MVLDEIKQVDDKIQHLKQELSKAYIEKLQILAQELKTKASEVEKIVFEIDDSSLDFDVAVRIKLSTSKEYLDVFDIEKVRDTVEEMRRTVQEYAWIFLDDVERNPVKEPITVKIAFIDEDEEEYE